MSGHPIRQGDLHRGPGGDDAGQVGEVAPPVVESVANRSSEINPIVLAIWLSVQLGALALAAWRVPLAAQYPQPGEFQAVRVLLAVQFLASALLCPTLLRGWRMALVTIASASVFVWLAGALSAWSITEPLLPTSYLTLWLAGLFVWMMAVGARVSHVVAAVVSAYAAGGPLLWYLGQDVGNRAETLPHFAYGPLLPVLISPHRPTSAAWWCLSIMFLAGFLASIVHHRRRR